MGTSYLGQMRSKVDNARAMFMCITFAILRVSQSARTSSPEFYSSSHVPPLLWKVGQVSTRALLFKDDQFVSVFLCALRTAIHVAWLGRTKSSIIQFAALLGSRKEGEVGGKKTGTGQVWMKQKQNLACTLIHILPLFHLFVAAKRSLASNTPLQDHTVLWLAGIIFSNCCTVFTLTPSILSSQLTFLLIVTVQY